MCVLSLGFESDEFALRTIKEMKDLMCWPQIFSTEGKMAEGRESEAW